MYVYVNLAKGALVLTLKDAARHRSRDQLPFYTESYYGHKIS